jgi:hypothetical protein
VLYFVDLNQPRLLRKIPVAAQYGYVKKSLSGARGIGLISMQDLVNYVCMTLIYGDQWHEDADIADLMRKVKAGDLDFSDAIKLLPEVEDNEKL